MWSRPTRCAIDWRAIWSHGFEHPRHLPQRKQAARRLLSHPHAAAPIHLVGGTDLAPCRRVVRARWQARRHKLRRDGRITNVDVDESRASAITTILDGPARRSAGRSQGTRPWSSLSSSSAASHRHRLSHRHRHHRFFVIVVARGAPAEGHRILAAAKVEQLPRARNLLAPSSHLHHLRMAVLAVPATAKLTRPRAARRAAPIRVPLDVARSRSSRPIRSARWPQVPAAVPWGAIRIDSEVARPCVR